MPLVRVPLWDGKGVLAVEVKLLLDDAEGFLGDLALYGPVEDVIRDVSDILREFVCRDDLLDFGSERFILIPAVSLGNGLLSGYREILHRCRLVIPIRAQLIRKKFPPLPRLPHVLDDFWDKRLICLLRVLLVEDAV